MEGIVHSIESLATLDGEGLRCCVFLAGCPLRCAFCHNPDTWQMEGKRVTPEEMVQKAKRFKPYFGKTGGITFSGGEPLLQAAFIRQTVPLLEKENIPYIIDTSGQVPLSEDVRFVLERCQEVLLDLKFWDDASYLKYTGKDMQQTLKILSFLEKIGKETVIRTVVIPGINDSKEVLSRYLSYTNGLSCVKKYELLPFHTMGFFKYEKLGIENPFAYKKALPPESLEKIKEEVFGNKKSNGV